MFSLKALLQFPLQMAIYPTNHWPWWCDTPFAGARKTANCPDCMKRSSTAHCRHRCRMQHLSCIGLMLWSYPRNVDTVLSEIQVFKLLRAETAVLPHILQPPSLRFLTDTANGYWNAIVNMSRFHFLTVVVASLTTGNWCPESLNVYCVVTLIW